MRKVFSRLLLVAFLMAAALPARAGSAPATVVETFQADLIAVMKQAEEMTPRQRFERLLPSVDRSFHLPAMARIILGPAWAGVSEAQRNDLVAAFRRMSVATLATLFDGYDGESFHTLGTGPGPNQTLVVETELTKSDGDTVDIAYVMHEFAQQGWRIIDVVVDHGISELNVRRSEYHRILKDRGVEGLTQVLDDKADTLLNG